MLKAYRFRLCFTLEQERGLRRFSSGLRWVGLRISLGLNVDQYRLVRVRAASRLGLLAAALALVGCP
uniref:helix-turn-helix domain-containing protein n=1 Tax=Hylemonella sp. TaxID=2066020 RepID=UPI0035AE149F